MRIACWSGPRNISTAMMYAFGNRPDFAVWDEPFYAPFLVATGRPDPMRDKILSYHETNADLVAATCAGSIPEGKPHFFMKHMALHMLPEFPKDWFSACTHIHLIRHPARVVASYAKGRPDLTFDDIGFWQQDELYDRTGGLVVSSEELRAGPRATLTRLCAALDLEFDPSMLSWPPGGHRSDGVWADHWYHAVHASTGFAGEEHPLPHLTGHLAELAEQAMPHYERLRARSF